jgi:fructan beta-fructosidase
MRRLLILTAFLPALCFAAEPYSEPLRPQFHFTANMNWLNDPNGLVFFGGEYHLFFQHNPKGTEWGNMTWGHAVSPDLVHWTQVEHALVPDALGTMFSGSAAVDVANSGGFQTGTEPALVALYTAAGDTSPESKGKPFTQCLAYSNDRGRTWTKYAHNPVLPNIAPGNRDPKIVWHAPTKRWIMALYRERSDFAILSSPDLKTWMHLQDLTIPGSDECPDFFEIPLEGTNETRWIFTTANGRYLIGSFDGRSFTPESGPYPADVGPNFYAVQSYSDVPDRRRVQIAWMRDGRYPGMPFNQQMSFPCDLILRNTADGPRLFRKPVKEITTLYADTITVKDAPLSPDPFAGVTADCIDLTLTLRATTEFALSFHGHPLTYSKHTLTFLNRSLELSASEPLKLRVLLDRTSVELFPEGGFTSFSACFVPIENARPLSIQSNDGAARRISAETHPLKSAWVTRP